MFFKKVPKNIAEMKIKLLKLMNDYKFYVLSFWLTAILGMLSFVLTLIFAFLGNITFSVVLVLLGYILLIANAMIMR